MKKLCATILLSLPLFFFGISTVLAQGGVPNTGTGGVGNPAPSTKVTVKLENPFKFGNSLYDVVKAVVNNVIMPIGGVLCVLAFIYAGFSYVTAGGNSTKIADANRTLLYAAIGTAVLLGAWVIAQVIETTIKQLAT